MRKTVAATLLALLPALLLPCAALAHRVNIFAWVEGGDILVECGFKRSNPARNSEIAVFDAIDGRTLLTTRTDDDGRCRFPIPIAAREHGLRIRVNAGEGHQNEWNMSPREFGAPDPFPSAAPLPEAKAPAPSVGVTAEEIRAIVDTSLEAKLAPLRAALALREEPSLADIIGGLGWILGLTGIALHLTGRRK